MSHTRSPEEEALVATEEEHEYTKEELDEAEHRIQEMTRPSSIPPRTVEALGAAAGAVVGAVAGPVGAIAGAVIGGAVGAVAGGALMEEAEERHHHDEELDEEIGVIGGNIGEAPPDQPPARIGAFSRASLGAGGGGESPSSDGPMQNVD